MENYHVEILGGSPGEAGKYLKGIINSKTGEYYYPLIPKVIKERMGINKAADKNGLSLDSVSTITAIIDTGMLIDHPMIKNNLIESIDFTGEGVEDLNGHGTIVSLIFLSNLPYAKILNVKALNRYGKGTEKNLIEAFEWIVDWKNKNKLSTTVINISAGIYQKKWGLLDCKGGCKLCKAADWAGENGIIVVAAAGNEKGVISCPANSKGSIAVGATDVDGQVLGNTGKGEITAFGQIIFAPLDIDMTQNQIEELYRKKEQEEE